MACAKGIAFTCLLHGLLLTASAPGTVGVRGPGGEWHLNQKEKAEGGKTTIVNFEIP